MGGGPLSSLKRGQPPDSRSFFCAALQTLELLAIAVVWVCEATVRATPRRILGVNLLNRDAVFFGFVFDLHERARRKAVGSPAHLHS